MMILGIAFSDIGTWASIISLIATILIAINTGSIKKKVQRMMNFRHFKADKESLENELRSINEIISKEEYGDHMINISDLSLILRKLDDYKLYMTRGDKAAFKRCKKIARKGEELHQNRKLINDISTLIGFVSSRIDHDVKNL